MTRAQRILRYYQHHEHDDYRAPFAAAGTTAGAGTGALVGKSVGLAFAGTAIAGTIPFAVVGGVILGLSGYILGSLLSD